MLVQMRKLLERSLTIIAVVFGFLLKTYVFLGSLEEKKLIAYILYPLLELWV
jgi:hypothetical protein